MHPLSNKIDWHLETRKIKDLKPNPKNPRYLSKEDGIHLEMCLDKFGLIERPIINLDNMIIGGHQRINLLKKKKVKEVECWVPDHELEEKEVDELCIRLNKNQGAFDFDILANQFDALDLLTYGFTEEQLIGPCMDIEETTSEESEKKKNLKSCPACGHEF
jgi:hypothetical protein